MFPYDERALAYEKHVMARVENLRPILEDLGLERFVTDQSIEPGVSIDLQLARARELLVTGPAIEPQLLLTPTPEGRWIRQKLDSYPDHVHIEGTRLFHRNMPIGPIAEDVVEGRILFDLYVGGSRTPMDDAR